MKPSREAIVTEIVLLLRQLAGDWEYNGEITEDTYLVGDLGFESLDIVVLGTAVQEHYRQVLPFTEFFAEIGQRNLRDISVAEWADFVAAHLTGVQAQEVSR